MFVIGQNSLTQPRQTEQRVSDIDYSQHLFSYWRKPQSAEWNANFRGELVMAQLQKSTPQNGILIVNVLK